MSVFARSAWVFAIVCVYVASFALPAWNDYRGGDAFLAAARLQFNLIEREGFDLGAVGWAPNPLLWLGLGCLLARRDVAATALGLAATLAACTWMPLAELLVGYYVWLLSMAGLAAAGAWCGTTGGADEATLKPTQLAR